jgi:hypothetical protein
MADKTTPPKPAASSNGISKIEAVKRALQALGTSAARSELQAYIRDNFAIQMDLDHISSCKSDILRSQAGRAKSKGKKKAQAPAKAATTAPAPVPAPKAASAPKAPSGPGISLRDIETVKDLVGRVGAGQLRGLIDLLAR